jgi:hypothetical protein
MSSLPPVVDDSNNYSVPNPGSAGGNGNQPNYWGSFFSGIGDLWGANQLGNMNFPNPANGAMGYFNQAIQGLPQYFQPYMQAGQNALPGYQNVLNQLTSNPGQFINQVGQNYQASPGYQFNVQQATNAANRAGAAGGMAGSPQEQQNLAGTVSGLANQDYYNYLSTSLGQFDQGLQGQGNLVGMGYGASKGLGEDIANLLSSQGSLAYAGQANQNEMEGGNAGAQAGLEGAGGADFLSGLFGGGGGSSIMSALGMFGL